MNMVRISTWAPLLLLAFCAPSHAQIDLQKAEQYFGEAQQACGRDAGRLWGVSLCGPLMFVEPNSRALVSNQADAEGRLQKQAGVFVGSFPKEKNVANHAVEWAGVLWTQLRWPLSGRTEVERQGLMAHEMFHRAQEKLGLKMASPANAHLDAEEGRVLLRAEMRALRQALLAQGRQRQRATEDAMMFRAERRSAYPNAEAEETALELNEGLCEYSGIKLSRVTLADQYQAAADALARADQADSYVRSFAYATGPAYGLLLDVKERHWRKSLLRKQVGLEKLLRTKIPSPAAMESRGAAYGLSEVRAGEAARRKKNEERLAQAKARFIDGPSLVIPLVKAGVQFDPNSVYPFGEHGTVYPTLRLTDEWGILTVNSGGALVASDWSKVTVPASGEGWELELKPGWSRKLGARSGDWVVGKDE
jgi:hypothetical protein